MSSSNTASGKILAIQLRQICKSFGPVDAVRGVDLDILPGEIVAILGPNGAGKTSTMDIILGLSGPSSGQATIFGLTPRQAITKGLVSTVMQTGGLLKDLTVKETVTYTSKLFTVTRSINDVMDRAGILNIADRLVGKCSGGEQQRLRFAMALLPDPELLLLDEPTQGMDVEGRRHFWDAIREDAKHGRTIVFATHYLEEADAYADRIVFMRKGRIVADGTAAEIKALASGRTLRATLPNADAMSLHALLGVQQIEIRGDNVLIHSGDTDSLARHLLNETAAHDLEIRSRGLEDAFVVLTGDNSNQSSDRRHSQ